MDVAISVGWSHCRLQRFSWETFWLFSRCIDTSMLLCGLKEFGPLSPEWKKEVVGNHKLYKMETDLTKMKAGSLWPAPPRGDWQPICLGPPHTAGKLWLPPPDWRSHFGWKPGERLTDIPRRLQNSFQKWEINWGPQSETMSLGRPRSRKTSLAIISPSSLVVGSLLRGTRWIILEKQSTILRMDVLPEEGGRLVIEIYRYARPGTWRNRKWIEQTCWRSTRGLCLAAVMTFDQVLPPKLGLDQV